MKISLFTPSHNPRWLDEVYESLKAQTHEDWEWVVLLNGSFEWNPPKDHRVRCQWAMPWVKGVGALKAKAVGLCTGEILLELDHDDLLMPTALERVAEAFAENPEVGFVYSDFAQINEDGTPNFSEFDRVYGWSYRDENGYHVTDSKSPHPHHVALIWFAPNHLRAFRRTAYDQVGGYNTNLDVLDDQELMCRLYLVCRFHHIKENLYLQRVHPNQTQVQPHINGRIQQETWNFYSEYITPMTLKWARDNNLMALDLGGAHNAPEGFTTVDLHDADIVGDVYDIFASMDDNTVGVIRASDFLEHLDPDRKVEFWNEAHRVLADGGMILTFTPHALGNGAFQDPTHRSFYVEQSHWYWTDRNYQKYVPEITARFQVSQLVTFFPTGWHQAQNINYVQANLIALKNGGERFGGILAI